MMRMLVLGTTLCVALSLPLGAETAFAKADDASAQRPTCRLSNALRPLKLISPTDVAQNTASPVVERISRRVNYSPVPGWANARERASSLVPLERQSTSLVVGVGF